MDKNKIKEVCNFISNHCFVVISPDGCSQCPFATLNEAKGGCNHADEDEGYYDCELLKETIWGEDPKCDKDTFLEWFRKQ